MAKHPIDSRLSRETAFAIGGFVGGAVTAGLVAFFVIGTQGVPPPHGLRESDITGASKYQFIDPLIGLSSAQQDSPQYAGLQRSVADYIVKEQQNGLTEGSVQVRNISMGQGFTVNSAVLYSPASLYKVPVMLAYYKLAESDPSVLTGQLIYTGASDLNMGANIPSPVALTPGGSYSIEQLIEHMIEYSDNNAVTLLTKHLADTGHADALTTTMSDLGVPYGSTSDFLTVNAYSIFFRVLYNATYLSDQYSEKALALLDKTDFIGGIEAGVPNNIDVAHKFGDSNELSADGTQIGFELHDCGIVYYPSHPYLLCIMTKGSTIASLERIIAGISSLVYKDMEQRYPASSN